MKRLPAMLCAALFAAAVLFAILAPMPSEAAASDQINRVVAGKKQVALTFDADSWPGSINTILSVLKKHNTKVTFFLTGTYLTHFTTQTKAIYKAGQEIASHGYDHQDYRNLTSAQIQQRLAHWEQTYSDITGDSSELGFWRAPYGYSNTAVRQSALNVGYTTVYWTLDSLDTVGAPKSASFIRNRILNTSWINLDGAIILIHVNATGTVNALDGVLTTLENRGLKVVTISQLLNN